ncbi:MAG: aldehyde dehydrogenase family protein, partial [Planctomycetes bacterium]|nr:aldehyde dehydrogenase family protein [Planctomycetota bacterium]
MIAEMIQRARVAQAQFEKFNQKEVDAIVRAIGKVVFDNAEELARDAVDETRMGVFEDKIAKNKGKSLAIWNNLKDKNSVGIIGKDEEKKLVYVAKPVGVVGAVTPTTNPVVTPMCNAMFALKGRNAIIVAPHPRAKLISNKTVRLMNEEIAKLNGPENLIQCIEEPSIPLTSELMKAVDVLVATGGPGMVSAAYSSGKPSYGVGAGNVQVVVDRGYDYEQAAQHIIAGRKFDNGIICSGEQSVIAPRDEYSQVIAAFEKHGAFYVEDQETVDKFRAILFEDGHIAKDVVGQSVQAIAKLAGVEVPDKTQVILLRSNDQESDVLRKEKMCPVMVALQYDSFEQATALAKSNLLLEGAGHTSAVHSNNQEHIEYIG